jgi:anaerobic magnesium-protoporphyrin IX monomethyl ester cyclase
MTRRRVVLYNPRAVFYTMPLALLAVGSHLDPERYEVIVIDGRLERDPEAAVVAALDGALCLGVTVLTGHPIVDALAISRAAKRARPEVTVVWGGWHPSMFATECLADAAVDVTVQAQGEATFAEIVDRLSAGESLDGCEGCTFREAGGAVVRNAPRALTPLEAFRPFDYGLLSIDRYYALKGRRQLDYISSQGCHFRCAFCADPFVYQRKWVGLPPARVGDELGELWRRHRFVDVNFQDETFFTRAERVDAIAESLLAQRLPISWAATMRADQGTRLPDEILARCRRSGFRRALVGVESGWPATLQRIHKDITIEQVFITAEKLRRHGIAGQFPFIVGFPGEPPESMQASLDVALRLRAMSPDFRTPFFYFRPYPGATLTEAAVRDGYRLPASLDEWAAFDFVGSASSPWVPADVWRRIERFKFYQALAYDRAPLWRQPLQRAARWRCHRHDYRWPIEMAVGQFVSPPEALS